MYARLTSSQAAAWVAQGPSPASASSQRRSPSASCPFGSGLSARSRAHASSIGIAARRSSVCSCWPSNTEKKPATAPSRSRTTENVSGSSVHQRSRSAAASGPSCLPAIEVIAQASSRPRGLDGERLRAAREERLADDRVVDQVEHVGRVAPELGGSRLARLGTERAPGRAPVGAVPVRVRAAQEAGDRVAHGLVDDEPVAPSIDERQVEQAVQRLGAVLLLEHRREQRLRGPPHDRGRLERAPGELVLHVFEVEARELIDDAGHRRVLERELRTLGDAGRGERERERMAAGDPVQARGLFRQATPLCSSSEMESASSSGPSGSVWKPSSANQPATGRSRPLITRLAPSGKAGTSTWRSHVSISLKTS